MTGKQLHHIKTLATVAERAAYMLEIGVTAKVSMEGLTPVYRAAVVDATLPVHSEDEAEAIQLGKEWLEGQLT